MSGGACRNGCGVPALASGLCPWCSYDEHRRRADAAEQEETEMETTTTLEVLDADGAPVPLDASDRADARRLGAALAALRRARAALDEGREADADEALDEAEALLGRVAVEA